MRSRLAWFLGGLGLVAAVVLRRPRPLPPTLPPEPATPDPRAEELRRRLEESRSIVEEREEFEGGETPVDRAEPAPADPGERRRRVHEQGRAAAEEMRGDHGA